MAIQAGSPYDLTLGAAPTAFPEPAMLSLMALEPVLSATFIRQ
jgi:hypothetical protein